MTSATQKFPLHNYKLFLATRGISVNSVGIYCKVLRRILVRYGDTPTIQQLDAVAGSLPDSVRGLFSIAWNHFRAFAKTQGKELPPISTAPDSYAAIYPVLFEHLDALLADCKAMPSELPLVRMRDVDWDRAREGHAGGEWYDLKTSRGRREHKRVGSSAGIEHLMAILDWGHTDRYDDDAPFLPNTPDSDAAMRHDKIVAIVNSSRRKIGRTDTIESSIEETKRQRREKAKIPTFVLDSEGRVIGTRHD